MAKFVNGSSTKPVKFKPNLDSQLGASPETQISGGGDH